MTESTAEVETTGISPVVVEYKRWENHGQKLAIDQAIHPAVLNIIPWDESTPEKIAEFVLRSAEKKP